MFFLAFLFKSVYNASRFLWAGTKSVRLTPQDLAVFTIKYGCDGKLCMNSNERFIQRFI